MSESEQERSKKRDALKHELEGLTASIKRAEEKKNSLTEDRQNEINRLAELVVRQKRTIQVVLQQLEFYGDSGVRRRPGRPSNR